MESMVITLDHLTQGSAGDDRPECLIRADLEGRHRLSRRVPQGARNSGGRQRVVETVAFRRAAAYHFF